MPKINQSTVLNFPVPLIPLNEQKEIVRILDNILNKETESSHLLELENEINLLEKSILSKAFRGELDTNDPNDEPAMELLTRILGQKEEIPKKIVSKKETKRPQKNTTISAKPVSLGISTSATVVITSKQAQSIMDTIKEKTGQKTFTIDELRKKTDLSYEELKSALFELIKEPLEANGKSRIKMTWEKNGYTLQLV